MLATLDIVIAFAVIMTVVSLLITTLVQMASSLFALRGKNLANALALTFQTIDLRLGEHAYALAAQILRDPIFSDSLFAPKARKTLAPVTDPALLKLIADERALIQAKNALAAASATAAPAAITLQTAVAHAAAAVANSRRAASPPTAIGTNANRPWKFLSFAGSMTLATAVRPGEVYRILHEISDLTPTEATLRGLPAILTEKSADLLQALGVPDQPAAEARLKLQAVVGVANYFATAEEKKAVLDSLGNFGSTVERATTEPYDRFQRWFGSAQDRAEQWFQVYVRGITIFFSIMVALLLQLDTIDIFHQLRSQPALVAALGQTAPRILAQTQPAPTANTSAEGEATQTEEQLRRIEALQHSFDKTGFDLIAHPFLGRWPGGWWSGLLRHFGGLLITGVLLTLGAPFWFNLLKNLMNLRPAVATLIERRPQSALSPTHMPSTGAPNS